MSEQVSGRAHQVAALVLSGVGVAGAVAAWRMGLWTMGSPDAGLLPFAASILLACLAGASVVLAPPTATPVDTLGWQRLASYGAAMLVFCAGPLLVGCSVAFAVALFIAMRVGEGMPVRSALAWSVGLSVAAVLVFRLLLGVPLPDPIVDRVLGL